MHTKKVGSAGRFGNKYGSRIRVAVAKAEADSRAAHACPMCLNKKLVRKAAGIWQCYKCNTTFAGGAYSPTTAATKIMSGEIAAITEELPAEAPKTAVAEKEKAIHFAPKAVEVTGETKEKEEKPKKAKAAKKKSAKTKAKKAGKKE